jgi:DNA-binding transcriptional LysR family regulator
MHLLPECAFRISTGEGPRCVYAIASLHFFDALTNRFNDTSAIRSRSEAFPCNHPARTGARCPSRCRRKQGLIQFLENNPYKVVFGCASWPQDIKALLPDALAQCGGTASGIDIDIHEAAPGEVLEMLYSRQADIGLIAADSVAQSSVGFRQFPVIEDPYVFAVPKAIDLAAIRDLDAAPAAVRRVLNSCIQFHFGNQHTLRVQEWYQHVLPSHRIVAHCRTYEVALELVRASFGVCLVPALAALQIADSLDGIALYATDHGNRHTVAIIADQYLRLAPYKTLVEALQRAGRKLKLPRILPKPLLIAGAGEGVLEPLDPASSAD